MANELSRVEREGHAEIVQSLMKKGITTAVKIHQILTEEHNATYSLSSVTRYVAKIKEAISDDAFKTIRDHVEKVVPEDLEALEEMEKQCLDWANEDPKDAADRLTDAALLVDGELDFWIGLLKEVPANEKERRATVKQIVGAALSYVLKDARLQKKRIEAMNTAIKIIDLKLRQAGLLEEEGKGRIIIYDRSSEYNEKAEESPRKEYRPKLIKLKSEDRDGP